MATFRKRLGKWEVRVRKLNNKTISKTFIEKADANRWAQEVETKIEKGLYEDLSQANQITLRELLQQYSKEVSSQKIGYPQEKYNIVIAMSETPSEEFQLDLSTEIEQFQEWLKNNKNGTYKEFLEDKTAFLTEEQKKDPKIIDLEPYLPNFEDVIKEYEKEQEEKKETMEDFIKRRSREMMLAEARNSGVPTLLKLKKRI